MSGGRPKARWLYVVVIFGLALVAFPLIPPTGRSPAVPTSSPSVTVAEPRKLDTATGPTRPESSGSSVSVTVETPSTSVPSESTKSVEASPQATQPESPSARPTVKMSEPTHISIAEIGYEADVSQMTTDNGVVDPPTKELTYRVTDRGSQPGEDADNTVYLVCHSASRSDVPCNTVYRNAAVGQTIRLTTEASQLTYRIESIETLSKDGEFENSEKVWSKVPGRLVLITCLQRGLGRSSVENFVVFAQLVEK